MSHKQQPRYQHVIDRTYWYVLVNPNNCNTIKFRSKTILSENFDDIHKFVIDDISENMASLVQTSKYGGINTVDITTIGNYLVKYI